MPAENPVEPAAPAGRSFSLRHLLTGGGLLMFGMVAVVLGVIVLTQMRIATVAADTRDNLLPVIVTHQEISRDAERLILFGEELLNSADPLKRRQAQLNAQALVYNEPAFRSDLKVWDVGSRTLSRLAELAARRNLQSELSDKLFAILLDAGVEPARGESRSAVKALMVRVMSMDSIAALDALQKDIHGGDLSRQLSLRPDEQDKLDQVLTLRRKIVEIDKGNAVAWGEIRHQLKSVTDTMATQAQLQTKERFSEIQEEARQAEVIAIGGLLFLLAVMALFGFATHRVVIRPLVDATNSLEQALHGEEVLPMPDSAISEVGSIVTAACTLVDNTRAIEDERRKALSARLESAEMANRSKSTFLSTMGHELRTPMNGVLGMAQLLQMGKLDDEQKGEVAELIRSAESLMAVINDILGFVAVDDGQVVIRKTLGRPAMLVQQVHTLFAPQAAARSLALKLEISADAPEVMELDVFQTQKIIEIFLENALDFTTQGEVAITVAPVSDECIEFAVRDTGIGMDQAVLDKLFQPFFQADGTATRSHGGIGLALATAQRIATAMGGKIRVESIPGAGSTFALALPLKRAA